MESALFTFIIPSEGYGNFVRDWLKTKVSYWKNVKVRHKRLDRMLNLCEVYIIVYDSYFAVECFRKKIFGRGGLLSSKGWLAITVPYE